MYFFIPVMSVCHELYIKIDTLLYIYVKFKEENIFLMRIIGYLSCFFKSFILNYVSLYKFHNSSTCIRTWILDFEQKHTNWSSNSSLIAKLLEYVYTFTTHTSDERQQKINKTNSIFRHGWTVLRFISSWSLFFIHHFWFWVNSPHRCNESSITYITQHKPTFIFLMVFCLLKWFSLYFSYSTFLRPFNDLNGGKLNLTFIKRTGPYHPQFVIISILFHIRFLQTYTLGIIHL